jgi:hypothetical protein
MAAGTATLGAQLRVNCLTFCQGLHNHHTGEDVALFPLVAERRPRSAPALERLQEEHERIAALVEDLRRTLTADTDPATTRAEVERLTTALEAHLTYEEEELIPLLPLTTACSKELRRVVADAPRRQCRQVVRLVPERVEECPTAVDHLTSPRTVIPVPAGQQGVGSDEVEELVVVGAASGLRRDGGAVLVRP